MPGCHDAASVSLGAAAISSYSALETHGPNAVSPAVADLGPSPRRCANVCIYYYITLGVLAAN